MHKQESKIDTVTPLLLALTIEEKVIVAYVFLKQKELDKVLKHIDLDYIFSEKHFPDKDDFDRLKNKRNALLNSDS